MTPNLNQACRIVHFLNQNTSVWDRLDDQKDKKLHGYLMLQYVTAILSVEIRLDLQPLELVELR